MAIASDVKWAAIILTGGRATRLGGHAKTDLVSPVGETTLNLALAACDGARPLVAVGPPVGDARVIWTREAPPFSGPARAIAAGVAALDGCDASWAVVLACDMPSAGQAVQELLRHANDADEETDGVVPVAGGHRQWLCAAYRVGPLCTACQGLPAGGGGESAGHLLRGLRLAEVAVPESWVADIDTPAELVRAGFALKEKGYP